MRPRAAFDLRQIGLAKACAGFPLEGAGQVLLGHLTAEAAESTFHQAQIAKFFAELHARTFDYDLQSYYCNL